MKTTAAILPLLLFVLLLSACGPREIRTVPPGLVLESVTIVDQQVQLNLLIENRNDIVVGLQAANLRMSFDETMLFETEWSTSLDLDPRGRESLRITIDAEAEGLALLQSTETARAYELRGLLQFEDLQDFPVNLRGFLHPVPGQPGRYR